MNIWPYLVIGLAALLIFETFLISGMIKQLSALYVFHIKNDPDSGLALGMTAPGIDAHDVFSGAAVTTRRAATKKMVFFLSTRCATCEATLSIVPMISSTEGVDVILIFPTSAQNIKLYFAEKWRTVTDFDFQIVSDEKSTYSDKFKIPYVPYVIVIDEDDIIGAKGMPTSSGEGFSMLRQTENMRNNRRRNSRSLEPKKDPVL